MALDAAVMLQAVRWTARMSALLLAVNLIVASRRLHERSAAVFYLGCAAVLRVKMRLGTGWRTVFFQAYAGRPLASLWFAWLAAGLLCALVTFASRLKSSLVPADPNALQSV